MPHFPCCRAARWRDSPSAWRRWAGAASLLSSSQSAWTAGVKDAADYEQLVRTMVSGREQLLTFWPGDTSYRFSLPRPTHLPATYLLDKAGRVVAQCDGRVPPEAWDRIADLL